jgi:DNA invertase Pin-like site-specific DNA recombinase
MTTALIYVRQSRTDEASVSLDVQEAACRRIADVAKADRVELYRDEDVSGGTERRPRYQAMLRRIADAKGTADVAVVAAFDLSRVSRDAEVLLRFHGLMTAKPWIAVRFADGMPFGSTAIERAMFGNSAVFAEWHKNVTSEKIRAAYQHRNARGAATGMPPYGYRRSPRLPGSRVEFEVVEEEARVVRRIFELYATGEHSAKAVCERLHAESIERSRARSVHGWLPDAVVDVLGNVAYIGKTYSISRARREGDVIDAEWAPTVDAALFARVQALMGDRRVFRVSAPAEYAFARLVVCAGCGNFMRATRTHGLVYYYCRRDVPTEDRCPAHSVREESLEAWADALFARIERLQPADFARAVRTAGERRQTPSGSAESVTRSLERLEKMFLWGHKGEDAYRKERARLDALRDELTRAAAPTSPVIARLSGVGRAWAHGRPPERRALLRALFERLYVDHGTVARYVARREYREEVEELVGRAVGNGLEYVEPGSLTVSEGRGKGGIRTLEGALHPLPA